jgi:hypothetical protein
VTRPKIPTYYGRLKVAPDAPPEVIRAAYRALVQKYHPDRHQGSIRHEIVLAALNKAQEVLLDPARRAAHDQWIRQEEVRLGWREPRGPAPGLAVRLGLIWSSVQEDGLPFGEAWRMHLSRPQRIGFALGGSLLLALAVAGVMGLLMLDADDGLYLIAPASVLSRNATAEGGAR